MRNPGGILDWLPLYFETRPPIPDACFLLYARLDIPLLPPFFRCAVRVIGVRCGAFDMTYDLVTLIFH